ncbi:MAG: cobalamin B12-binding domain-containing protein [Dehalococcoidales bacterium]|nr:cobalamin B12-binding domain-containing protein [Dehalococcoidales bacterium]
MKAKERKIRVLMAKVGLDGHERGARIVAFGLRDEGMEVIYTGIRQSMESIVQTAIQEDVDVVGLSSMSGAHELFADIVKMLKDKGADDVLVIGGGIIPDEEIPGLKKAGVAAIFTPGTRLKDIADYVRQNVRQR